MKEKLKLLWEIITTVAVIGLLIGGLIAFWRDQYAQSAAMLIAASLKTRK